MGEPIKDHMDLDSVGHESVKQASPRPSLQMSPRLSLQMYRDLQDDNLDDSSIYMHPGNLAQELPPDRPPPTPQKFPPLDLLSEKSQYDLGPAPAVPERRASQYNMPPPILERRASQYDIGPPPERRASQFDLGLQPPASERRPSSLLDKEALYALPERSVAPHQSSFLPEAMLERLSVLQPPPQQYHPSAAPTPRLSTAGVSNFPVLRDSGAFMSSQAAAISEAEPYSPASGVSSSGEGGAHIDRDAMLARAYHEKQQSQVKAWERHRSTKNLNKYESEIARITAWEACQVAKAEALMKKSEEELEKKRANLIEGFKNKIASVHRRADEWRALSETRRVEEILRVEEGAARFRATGNLPKKPLLHIQSLRDMCCGFTLPYNRFMNKNPRSFLPPSLQRVFLAGFGCE